MSQHEHDAPMIPLEFERLDEPKMIERAQSFAAHLHQRRTVREFAPDPIPDEVLRQAIWAASSAPSGANKQPYTFVIVRDPQLKQRIREAAEQEERAFYQERAPQDWLDDLKPFGTDADKPFLENAPALIVIFQQNKASDGSKHYYVKESVGIATGMLLAALHHAGLATLTHTPSPMQFLAEILERPDNERAYLLIPVGYPAEDCQVPDIERKSLDAILVER